MKRKSTGGRRKHFRGRRAFEKSRYANEPILGQTNTAIRKVRGYSHKIGLRKINYANILESSSQIIQKLEILKVLKNPANRDYERRGVITKGCTIETEKGIAKVTSRPGQTGVVNAILLK